MNNISRRKYSENVKYSVVHKCHDSNSLDIGEEGIIYTKGNINNKYIANITTMVIWDLIDGKLTSQEIAQIIANICEIPIEEIEKDIYMQIATFKDLCLVELMKV